ncbi:hypothetical protein [Paracoccus sp. PARArs4]|uniref:hypothetical protein n=1 Tax=Paracoccus sp. PARArs4 TaxID=2853442 RepID=UPI0024A7A288|nr:hypothetical protein [Paracoccus sp. PARArs4]
MHPQRQLGIADSALFLKKAKDTAVYCVKVLHGRRFFENMRPRQRFLHRPPKRGLHLRSTFARSAGIIETSSILGGAR